MQEDLRAVLLPGGVAPSVFLSESPHTRAAVWLHCHHTLFVAADGCAWGLLKTAVVVLIKYGLRLYWLNLDCKCFVRFSQHYTSKV